MDTNILEFKTGETRICGFDFSDQQEIVDGDTLTGTPTVTVTPSTNITVGAVTISGSTATFSLAVGSAAALTDRVAKCTASTTAGAVLIEYGTLQR